MPRPIAPVHEELALLWSFSLYAFMMKNKKKETYPIVIFITRGLSQNI